MRKMHPHITGPSSRCHAPAPGAADPLAGFGFEIIERHTTTNEPYSLVIHEAATPSPLTDKRELLLYLHGWSDYFFHPHVAAWANERGFDVCAIDLRGYGRSIRPTATPTAIRDLGDYAEEIEGALEVMASRFRGKRRPLLYAHSTGALTALTWAQRNPGRPSGLILNSPWLEMHGGPPVRTLARPIIEAIARHSPTQRVLPPGPDVFARAHRADFGGPWEWAQEWKPARGHAFPACTLAAVLRAQTDIARGAGVSEPILVAHSTRSRFARRFRPELTLCDTVLDVRQIARRASDLGPRVRRVEIPGGTHDLALSRVGARRLFFSAMNAWLSEEWAPGPRLAA